MKLKIETIEEKNRNLIEELTLASLYIAGIINFIAFIYWEYPPELLRFTIGVIVINAFIFIRIE